MRPDHISLRWLIPPEAVSTPRSAQTLSAVSPPHRASHSQQLLCLPPRHHRHEQGDSQKKNEKNVNIQTVYSFFFFVSFFTNAVGACTYPPRRDPGHMGTHKYTHDRSWGARSRVASCPSPDSHARNEGRQKALNCRTHHGIGGEPFAALAKNRTGDQHESALRTEEESEGTRIFPLRHHTDMPKCVVYMHRDQAAFGWWQPLVTDGTQNKNFIRTPAKRRQETRSKPNGNRAAIQQHHSTLFVDPALPPSPRPIPPYFSSHLDTSSQRFDSYCKHHADRFRNKHTPLSLT